MEGAAQPTLRDEAAQLLQERQGLVERGFNGLLTLQGESGAFGTSFRVASTSLACLALMANGSTFDRGPHADAVARGLYYILDRCARRGLGYFITDGSENGRMHSHGYAALFLAEIYGTIPASHHISEEVRRKLEGAIKLIIASQTRLGGWGYHYYGEREFGEDEASVTVTQVQALRAAKNAGITVPAGVIDQALEYLERSSTPDGSFRYSLTMGEGGRTSFELTAASVSTLNFSGAYNSAVLADGLNNMVHSVSRRLEQGRNPSLLSESWYYYGTLYASMALYQASRDPELRPVWEGWYQDVSRHLLDKKAVPDDQGRLIWESDRGFGSAYATSVALLVLQLPKGYLPINQR